MICACFETFIHDMFSPWNKIPSVTLLVNEDENEWRRTELHSSSKKKDPRWRNLILHGVNFERIWYGSKNEIPLTVLHLGSFSERESAPKTSNDDTSKTKTKQKIT